MSLAFLGKNSLAFFAMEFVTFPFISKILSILIDQYKHFSIGEHVPLWQSLIAVVGQLIILSAIAPINMKMHTQISHYFVCQLLGKQ